MRRIASAAALLLVFAGCGGPTERDIEDSLEETLRSVAGEWVGVSAGPPPLRLEFQLQEGSSGQVSGSGTMKEEGVTAAVPITVTGTFQRPVLSLTFSGMTYEGRSVQGTSAGNYTSAGGISTTLQLTGAGYSRSLPILLQEK